jgi:sterol desaturase/sphingolipid hydroxylase (fatty acid hydroxylase superfamily)
VQDLTVAAIPGFFATMGIEHKVLQRRAARQGPSTGDYERRDTLTSLAMGVGSLTIPLLVGRALRPVTPGRGRWAKVLVGAGVAAAAVTTAADVMVRRAETEAATGQEPDDGADERPLVRWARRVRPSTGVAAVAAGVVAASTGWAARTSGQRLYDRYGAGHDLGTGVAATLGAIFAWDAIYYWNHRIQHESRWLWAIHVVHHSSERYNLSTALRQPVGENFGMFVPYGLLCALGLRPSVIEVARGVNLIYQYWIHTETIPKLGPVEEVFNTPSHHRVHHGSNRRYLDRNHGSILIVWDRLFGTFEREDDDEPVVYGLTKNIHTFDPLKVATHEHAAMLRAVARSTTWRDRLGHVVRGPGWSPTSSPTPAPAVA